MLYMLGARMLPWCGMALLAACAGNGAGLDANGEPLGSGDAPPAPLTANFQSIQDNVFTPICVRCHSGAGAPQGLQLDAAHSYALLVGVPSNEDSGLERVKPGAPDASYLIRKLQGSAGIVGAQMPFGGPPLPQATIDVVRQWISDGAANAPAAAAAKFAVAGIAPEQDAHLAAPLARVVVAFSAELDANLLNDTTVQLERVIGEFATPVGPFSAQLAEGDARVLLITPQRPLGAGSYRVTLRGSGGGALADVDAHVLGDDYVREFTVEDAP
jgi:hypothetical protein